MTSTGEPFTLGAWLVQPSLNRLSRGDDEQVQLEPKMMDVLVHLAARAGDVVSREALIDAVWPELHVTEGVLTRAVSGLRRALGDDARSPIFIETIAKRGYLLLPKPVPTEGRSTPAPAATATGGQYVVGQWVRGERFYGRGSQIAEALDGPRDGLWVVGTRRSGKTSFLKQLEHLAAAGTRRGLVPVFWDLEGAEEDGWLALGLQSALADAAPRLEAAGIAVDDLPYSDPFHTLEALRRRVSAHGRTLLLLCDEAEELVLIARRRGAEVRRLRRVLLAHGGMRTVLASGPRLWDLAVGSDTSPFLDGFLPPLYLGSLDPGSARRLVLQEQFASTARPAISDADVASICDRCGRHPFLLQLLSKRFVELGDLEAASRSLAADRSVTTLFEVDLALLDETQQRLLKALARGQRPDDAHAIDPHALLELRQLGLVVDDDDARPRVANPLLRQWLAATD